MLRRPVIQLRSPGLQYLSPALRRSPRPNSHPKIQQNPNRILLRVEAVGLLHNLIPSLNPIRSRNQNRCHRQPRSAVANPPCRWARCR